MKIINAAFIPLPVRFKHDSLCALPDQTTGLESNYYKESKYIKVQEV